MISRIKINFQKHIYFALKTFIRPKKFSLFLSLFFLLFAVFCNHSLACLSLCAQSTKAISSAIEWKGEQDETQFMPKERTSESTKHQHICLVCANRKRNPVAFDSKFFTGKYAPSTIHTHLKHNFIGWHATVVNDKGIDTLDSMMFRLFIFMCVRSYLQRLCCRCCWFFFCLFFPFSSLLYSFLHNTHS